MVEAGRWLGSLRDELRAGLAPVFCQARSRLTAFSYVDALLAGAGDRRSCWQLAEAAVHPTPRRMQALLADHAWDHAAALEALQRFILGHLDDLQAILVLDETAELKQGQMTVGVARQHAGITGQVENCQTVVNCAYVTGRGDALFDFRLYLPRSWCEDESRRERAHVPADVEFATKTELGTQMITGAIGAGARFGWAAAGEVYGRSSKLRAGRQGLRARRAARLQGRAPSAPRQGAGGRRGPAGARRRVADPLVRARVQGPPRLPSGCGWPPPCPGTTCCSAAASPIRPGWRTSPATPPPAGRCPWRC